MDEAMRSSSRASLGSDELGRPFDHRDDAFRVEGLPALVEMTSLSEGGCDLP
jgi:hypothetical protein